MLTDAQLKHFFTTLGLGLNSQDVAALLSFMNITPGSKINVEDFANRFDYF